jgi:Replication-relaxation
MQLTERDREIIRLVWRHRFLRSPQIVALMGTGSQQFLRRLQLLYHHGYLERPRAQIDYYHQGGSRHMVYGLGGKGAAFLKQTLGTTFRELRWGEKNRSVGRIFLEHALLVSDVMVAIELACREARIRLLSEEELALRGDMRPRRQPFHWKVNITSSLQLGVIPDRVFALEFPDPSGNRTRAFFFLEADRGTMPVTRRNLSQTSFYRKLLAYEATWSQSIHRTRFGFHRFRVLTVTTSVERVSSLLNACSKLKSGHGLFLFADRTVLEKSEDIFSPIWLSGGRDQIASLLD